MPHGGCFRSAVGDAMGLGWKKDVWNLDFDVVDFAQADSGDIWAVAQRQHRGGTTSAILRRGLEEWVSVVDFERRLEAISAHRDNSKSRSSQAHVFSWGTVERCGNQARCDRWIDVICWAGLHLRRGDQRIARPCRNER
jgi:hypothetical protein